MVQGCGQFLPPASSDGYVRGLERLLVGGLEHDIYFPFHIWENPDKIDELIFFKMVKTTNQIMSRKIGACDDLGWNS